MDQSNGNRNSIVALHVHSLAGKVLSVIAFGWRLIRGAYIYKREQSGDALLVRHNMWCNRDSQWALGALLRSK